MLHVYRHPYAGLECNDAPEHDNYIRLNGLEYLGEYAPRGPVVAERWEVRGVAVAGFPYVTRYQTRADALRGLRQDRRAGLRGVKWFHITTRKVCR